MKYIHFIINPIAGSGNNSISTSSLENIFNKNDYSIVVKESHFKKHAITLAKESVLENADIIVACGGDGTINEVASCLVNTPITLGIIPFGSGNGLSSNLNIPKNLDDALLLIKNHPLKKIDVGIFNEYFFFSNCGIGFDAQVIKNYETHTSRNLISYVKAFFESLKNLDTYNDVKIRLNGFSFKLKPFLIFISNSNELGYHISLTPDASLKDGLLDVLVIPKINFFKILLLTVSMLFKRQNVLKEVQKFKTKEVRIFQKRYQKFQAQIDGEFHEINSKSITISVLERNLSVIA